MRQQMFKHSNFGTILEQAGMELEFVNAPYCCTPADEAKVYDSVKQGFPDCTEYYEWYNASEDKTEYSRLNETVTFLEKVMEERGPFVGVVGFSQGGSLAHLIAYMQASGDAFVRQSPFKFIVTIGARRSRATKHQSFWDSPPPANLPKALLFHGERDTAVRPEESKLLAKTMPGSIEVSVPNCDHRIPNLDEGNQRKLIVFVQDNSV